VTLIVGFTHGQIQLVEIMMKECTKLFNEEVCLTVVDLLLKKINVFFSAEALNLKVMNDKLKVCRLHGTFCSIF
jgi:hypothetical protein